MIPVVDLGGRLARGSQRAASAARDLFVQKGATVSVELAAGVSAITAPDATPRSDSSGESQADEPWNEADRLYRRSLRLFTSGELAAWEAMHDDGFRGVDDRTGQPYLNVVRAVDGRLLSSDLYPLDDLEAAAARFHELDAPAGVLAVPGDGRPEVGFDPVASFAAHIDEIQTRGDIDAFVAVLHPSYRIIDYRQLGWGTLDADGMKERTRTLADLPGEVVVRTVRTHHIDPVFSCLERG